MKLKTLSFITALSLSTMFASAHAQTTVFSHSNAKGDICEQITGHWQGSGTVHKLAFTCQYNGDGRMQVTAPGEFSMHIDLTKVSGICPKGESLDFTGTCKDGVVKLNTPNADLRGDLVDQAGRLAVNNMSGQVWLTILGIRTAVDVQMNIHKEG